MRPSLLTRFGALVFVPVLVGLATAPTAHAQEDPTPVAEEVDYAVTASFDKAEYGSGDDFVVTITVANAGDVPIEQAFVTTESVDLDFGEQTWGELSHPGTPLAAGAVVTATATARLINVVESVRLEVNVGIGGDQWDPDDENVDAVLEAPVHQASGTVGGLVYGDRNGNGRSDTGEEMRGIGVTFAGGLPWNEYVVRTGSDGRYLAELPAGAYSVFGPRTDGWLFEEIYDFRVREGDQQLDLGGRRVGQPLIGAAMEFDRNRYAVGDPIRVRITLTNPSSTDVSGLVAWCARAGEPHELRSDGWGDLEYGGPGVLVPADTTREFEVTDTVPAGAHDRGYVAASCGFIVGDDVYNSAEAFAVADVPGGFGDYSGRVLEVRANGNQVPAARVRLMLVHRSGRVVARTRSDAQGGYAFRQAPYNEYRMRVTGPWKLVDPDQAYYVEASGDYPSKDVLIVRGPAEPGVGGGQAAERRPPAASPAAAQTAGTETLAGTGVAVGTPFLAGLLLLTTGGALLCVRPRRRASAD